VSSSDIILDFGCDTKFNW